MNNLIFFLGKANFSLHYIHTVINSNQKVPKYTKYMHASEDL